MGQLFGTDGVRGLANHDLTADFALRLASAAARVLADAGELSGQRPTALVARDPRVSGEFLEAAVVAGLASAGVDVRLAGIAPTPAAAHLTAALQVDMGVIISASHNPMPDNGIKFLARGGFKLADELEERIEQRLREHHRDESWQGPTGTGVGRIIDSEHVVTTYVNHLLDSVTVSLDGLRIVLDCANGAASDIAPHVFETLGATVVPIHYRPDGFNINDECGSTHLDDLQHAVVEHGADAGFAFDGDADRCLAVDEHGEIVDGDHLMAILAIAAQSEGRLTDATVVATVMSNLGFVLALDKAGIGVVRTPVGDRHVVEQMHSGGYMLGGEQSGHIVMSDYATTGDGVLTAIHVAARMASASAALSELAGVMTKLPQVLINVPDVDRDRVDTDVTLQAAVAKATSELGDRGRVLLRSSGTEPLVRVMVEAPTSDEAQVVAEQLSSVVAATLALNS